MRQSLAFIARDTSGGEGDSSSGHASTRPARLRTALVLLLRVGRGVIWTGDGSRAEQHGTAPAARLSAVKSTGAPTQEGRLAALEVALAETAYPEAIEGSDPLLQRQTRQPSRPSADRFSALTLSGCSPHEAPRLTSAAAGSLPTFRPQPSHRKTVQTVLTRTPSEPKTLADLPHVVATVPVAGSLQREGGCLAGGQRIGCAVKTGERRRTANR